MIGNLSTAKRCKRLITVVVLFGLAGFVAGIVAQQAEPSRRFWPPNFRPAAATPKAKPTIAKYRRTTPALPSSGSAAAEFVLGVTVWRLRPTQQTDQARILLTKSGKKSAFTPERVEASTAFSEGQMVQIGRAHV